MNEFIKQMNSDRIFIVAGPPGAGKTTYALQNMQPGDILIDLDHIAAALMGSDHVTGDNDNILSSATYVRECLINAIESNQLTFSRAFITTVAWPSKIQKRTGGKIIKLDPGYKETMRRIESDTTRDPDQMRKRKDAALKYYYLRGGQNV